MISVPVVSIDEIAEDVAEWDQELQQLRSTFVSVDLFLCSLQGTER